MLNEPWVAVLVGAALGFLSGLGVGGGSLLLLWLTLILGADQSHARLMNLMFFIPSAFVATLFRWKQSKPDWRLTLPAVCAGLAGSVIGNLTTQSLDLELLKKCFGVLFLLCGIRELFFRPKKKPSD